MSIGLLVLSNPTSQSTVSSETDLSMFFITLLFNKISLLSCAPNFNHELLHLKNVPFFKQKLKSKTDCEESQGYKRLILENTNR